MITQLNAAPQPIKSHVAVRAESEQTQKHWSPITTSVWGWFILEEAQRGVWMVCVCLCVSVIVGIWACGFYVLQAGSLVFWVETISAFSVAGGIFSVLVFANFHLENYSANYIHSECSNLSDMFWHVMPIRKTTKPRFCSNAFDWVMNTKILPGHQTPSSWACFFSFNKQNSFTTTQQLCLLKSHT